MNQQANKPASQQANKSTYVGLLQKLKKDGIVIIEDFVTLENIAKINAELNPIIVEYLKDPSKYSGYINSEFAVNRLFEADKHSEAANINFFENSFIDDIAKSCASKNVVSFQRMFEEKGAVGKCSVADSFHFDDWKHRFKAFLYLNDVDVNNCPFVYIKGSHNKSWSSRFRKELEYYLYGRNGAYGYFMAHEVDGILRELDVEPTVCTGKAGTLILVDTRGLHRGTNSVNGKRLLLGNYFGIRKK